MFKRVNLTIKYKFMTYTKIVSKLIKLLNWNQFIRRNRHLIWQHSIDPRHDFRK